MQIQISYGQVTFHDVIFHTEDAAQSFASELNATDEVYEVIWSGNRVKFFTFKSGYGHKLARDFEAAWVQRLIESKPKAKITEREADDESSRKSAEDDRVTTPSFLVDSLDYVPRS